MKPNPGSFEAVEQGCMCPMVDNNYGRGNGLKDGYPVFVVYEDCPLHGEKGDS
jgi:hypothetical protein